MRSGTETAAGAGNYLGRSLLVVLAFFLLVGLVLTASAFARLTFEGVLGPDGVGRDGEATYSVAAADFNGDGDADLTATNSDSDNLSVWLGNGDGTFEVMPALAAGDRPISVAAADFNGDGDADLTATNYNSDTLSVWLGNGDGTFEVMPALAAGSVPYSVAAADFNGDGVVDLTVTNNSSDTLSVWLGNGDGTFEVAPALTAGIRPYSVAVADFNGDGDADLTAANSFSDNLSIWLGNGDGTFEVAPTLAVGANPISVAVADFNGDGDADLAAANSQSNNLSVLLGNGDGTFGAADTYPIGINPSSVASADFDGDDVPDLALASFGAGDAVPDIYANDISILLNSSLSTADPSPDMLTFAATPQGNSSPARTATITNNGRIPLKVNGFTLVGTNPGDFRVDADTCQHAVPPGASCEVRLLFVPGALGSRVAVMRIMSNAPTATSVALAGTGEKPPRKPVPPVGKARIGKVKVKGPSRAKQGRLAIYRVKIWNSGDADATGVRLTVKGKGVKAKKAVGKILTGSWKAVRLKLRLKRCGRGSIKFRVTSKNAGGKTVKKKC